MIDNNVGIPVYSPADANGLRILIVEDNADCAKTMATMLRLDGHQVTTVEDGPQALACVAQEPPDVVLLDIGLPGMSGYEVARQLNADHPRKVSSIVAVTGYAQEDVRERSLAAGIDVHLVKPVDPRRLEAVLAECRRQQAARIISGAEARLQKCPYRMVRTVACGYEDGRLVLRGSLPTFFQMQLAQSIVAGVPHVRGIVNQIDVTRQSM